MENEYCAKHRCVPVNKHESIPRSNFIPSNTVWGSCQSCFDPYDLSSDDDEYWTPNNVAVTTPEQIDHAAHISTAVRLHLISLPEAPNNSGLINANLKNYHSDPMEISSTFLLPDITDWWRHQEETHSKYADLSNVAHNIFSIIPHGVRVEASFYLALEVIGWRKSTTTGGTIREKVVFRQFAQGNNGILCRRWPIVGYNERRKRLGNEESSGGKEIAQNGQGLQLFGDVAGQPEPMS